jgi:hypothetical protein
MRTNPRDGEDAMGAVGACWWSEESMENGSADGIVTTRGCWEGAVGDIGVCLFVDVADGR